MGLLSLTNMQEEHQVQSRCGLWGAQRTEPNLWMIVSLDPLCLGRLFCTALQYGRLEVPHQHELQLLQEVVQMVQLLLQDYYQYVYYCQPGVAAEMKRGSVQQNTEDY